MDEVRFAIPGLGPPTIKDNRESVQNGAFIIHYFSSPKGTRKEGKKFLGVQGVTDTVGDGVIPFTFHPNKKVEAGLLVTATATRTITGDISSFSAPRRVAG